MVPYYMGYA